MSPWRRVRSIVFDGAVAAALVGVVCLPVWPGVFTIDSQAIYDDAIADDIDTWYAPTLGWLWGVADQLGMAPAGALAIGVAGVVVALLAAYRLWLRPTAARLATAGTVLWPPVYGMLGWVGRDVWFLALLVGILALLGWAARLPRWRWPLVAAAGVAAWFAADARQNGFPALAVWGGVTAWWILPARWWRWVVLPVAAVAAVAVGSALRLAAIDAIDAERVYPEQYLYYRDLLDVSVAVDRSQLPPALFPSQDLDAVRRYPHFEEAFAGPDPVVVWRPFEGGGAVTAAAGDAWWAMVRARPLDYLWSRGRLYGELTVGRPERGVYFGVSDQLDATTAPFRQQFPAWNERRLRVLDVFDGDPTGVGGFLHVVWPYLLLGLTGAAVIAVTPGPLQVVGVAGIALQATLQAGLFLFAPIAEWRFQFFQVVLGIVLAVGGLAGASSYHQRWRTTTDDGEGARHDPLHPIGA